jgi:hypothetical protein
MIHVGTTLGIVRRSRAALLAAMIAFGTASAPAKAIIGGAPDGTRHPYAGYMSSPTEFCSGTLVSPTVFVTAAHCGSDGERVGVSVDPEITAGTSFTPGTFHQLPGFCRGCGQGLPKYAVPDLAVIKLGSPITVDRYATLPEDDESIAWHKHYVEDVGYGATGFDRGGGPPLEIFPSSRNSASLTLSAASDAIAGSYAKLSAQPSKGAFCFGDGGGPVLAGDTLLAANSLLNGRCTASSYAYRVDTATSLAFIAAFK